MPKLAEKLFPVDHPTAAGHFPGNPIIPGAVLLDEVLRAIAASEGVQFGPCHIRSAKFLRPVRPGDRMLICWNADGPSAFKFECFVDPEDRPALLGTAELGGKPHP